MEKQIQAFYGIFLDRVAEGRKLPREKVEAAAGGRVWSGRQALDRGLVDRLGSLDDAIALALERSGVERNAAEIRRSRWLAGPEVVAGAIARVTTGPLERALESIPEVRALAALSEMGPVLALPLDWVGPVP